MPLSEAHKRISTTKKLSEILLFDRRFTTSPTTDALFSECFQYETAVPAGLFARLTGSRNVQRPDHRQEAALGHRRRCHPRVHHQPAQESTLNNKNERLWMESIHSFPLIYLQCYGTGTSERGWMENGIPRWEERRFFIFLYSFTRRWGVEYKEPMRGECFPLMWKEISSRKDGNLIGAGNCNAKKRRISFMKSTSMATKNLADFCTSVFFHTSWHSGGRLISPFFVITIVPRCYFQEACSSRYQGSSRLC